jgi:RHS repeat-associated protein
MKTSAFLYLHISVFAACLLQATLGSAQGRKNVIILNAPESGNQSHVACREVALQPGYTYTAQAGSTMVATINEYQVCDLEYGSGYTHSIFNPRQLNTNLEVGKIAEAFNVSPSGAASYSIPLTVPPGSGGMQPNLSVMYSSQGGNGVMGMGWMLSGASSISRTGRTIYHDGVTGALNLDYNDRFMMDGQRLIRTAGGNYGSTNTTYGTEVETFSRITSYGQSGAGPLYFTVETKDGLTMQYGYTEDSRIQASDNAQQTVLMWLLNEVKDARGNYMTLSYHEDNASGEFWLERIKYTGNTQTGLSPYNEVRFVYQKRKDEQLSYVAGSPVRQSVVLTGVNMFANGERVHSYKFDYTRNVNTHLSEVTEFGTDGKQYNSTRFSYDFSGSDDIDVDRAPAYDGKAGTLSNIDINNDGFSDMISGNNGTWYLHRNDYTTRTAPTVQTDNPGGFNLLDRYPPTVPIDVDGDGHQDLIICSAQFTYSDGEQQNPTFYIYRSVNGVLTGPQVWHLGTSSSFKYAFGDFNGDRKTDIWLYIYNTGELSYIFSPADNSVLFTKQLGLGGSPSVQFTTVDAEGDGVNELMVSDHSNSYFVRYNPSLNDIENYQPNSDYPNQHQKIFTGDFNGDGKTDLLTGPSNKVSDLLAGRSSDWRIGYSDGKKYLWEPFPMDNNLSNINERTEYFVTDFNGDGKSDVFRKYADGNSTELNVYYSRGHGFDLISKTYNDDYIYRNTSTVGDFNGDGKMDVLYAQGEPTTPNRPFYLFTFAESYEGRLLNVSNGLGQTRNIIYSTLPQMAFNSRYSKASTTVPLVLNFQGPLTVVREVTFTNGINAFLNSTEYSYEGAMLHLRGRGFLGFTGMTVNEKTTSSITTSINNPPNAGNYFSILPKESTTIVNGQLMNKKLFSNTISGLGGGRHRIYTASVRDENAMNGIITTVQIHEDANGNIDHKQTQAGTDVTESISYFYEQKDAWLPSRMREMISTTTRSGRPAYTRKVNYTNYSNGLLQSMVSDENTIKSVTTEYTYNSYGAPLSVKVTGNGMESRLTRYEYDPYGRFVIKQYNPLDQSMEMAYEPAYGNVVSTKDLNQLVTTHRYDGFGRIKTSILPTGHKSTVTRAWAMGTPFTRALFSVQTAEDGSAPVTEYFDVLGRSIGTRSLSFDGNIVYTEKEFNARGQVIRSTMPYLDGTSNIKDSKYTYNDPFGRLTLEVTPALEAVTYRYTYGATDQEVLRPGGRNRTTVTDAAGAVQTITDNGGTIEYQYHSNGKPRLITAAGSTVEMQYDDFGNQEKLIDPDAGTTSYVYDALGQLISQTDARNNTTLMVYDRLGRMSTRTGAEGTTTWVYDSQPNGVGMTTSEQGFNGMSKTYFYDGFSRLQRVEENIEGTTYTTSYGYDVHSRMIKMTYPGGFAVSQTYNVHGYLDKVRKDSDGSLIWECKKMNHRNQITEVAGGNGLLHTKSFDDIGFLKSIDVSGTSPLFHYNYEFNIVTGNLNKRENTLQNLSESFSYDNLDRLTKISNTATAQVLHTTSYVASGNISSKTDAGVYAYQLPKPHAVTNVSQLASGGIPLLQQDITYTPFQKAATISEGNNTLALTYGTDYQRKKQVFSKTGLGVQQTKYYVGAYEKEVSGTNTTRELHYISGGDGICAIYVKNGGTDTLYYVYTDHLGSLSLVTSSKGAHLAEYSYDAWGRRRNVTDWTYSGIGQPLYFDRGYTGHEHLDQFGLINMNGRMYDPVVGRMLSPDNYVQDGTNTQSFNRYSYCWNNPLKYTDPTGDFLAIPFLAVGFAAEFSSNLIQGLNDPGGRAWAAVNNTMNSINNALQVPVYQNDKTKITVGLNPFNLGVSASATHKEGDFTFSGSAGFGLGGPFLVSNANYSDGTYSAGLNLSMVEGPGGLESRIGLGGGYGGFSTGFTRFGGHNSQWNWFVQYRKGDFHISMTNDAPLSDKFRTAAGEIGVGPVSYGFNLYTTTPPESEYKAKPSMGTDKNYSSPLHGRHKYNAYSSGSRVYAGMYLGYRNGNTISRIGVDAPWVQDAFQNGIHRLIGFPYFNTNNGPPTRLFQQTLQHQPYTLY